MVSILADGKGAVGLFLLVLTFVLEVAVAWLFMDVLEPSDWSQGFTDGEQRLLEQIQQGLTLTADLSRADIMLLVKQKDAAMGCCPGAAPFHCLAVPQDVAWTQLPLVDHPLLASGLNYGRNGQRQENLLDQGTPVVRQVLPVLSEAGRPIAALQVETNLIAWERQKRRDLPFRRAVEWLQAMELRGDLASGARLGPFGEWDGVLFVDEGYRIRYVSGIANNLYRRLGYLDDLHGKHIGDLNTKDEVLIRDAFRTQQCQEHQVVEGNRQWTRKVVPIWSYAPGCGRLAAMAAPGLCCAGHWCWCTTTQKLSRRPCSWKCSRR